MRCSCRWGQMHQRALYARGLSLSREAVPNSNHCIRVGTDHDGGARMRCRGRPECANSGHSAKARRTSQIDPKQKFLVFEWIGGVRRKAEVPPKYRSRSKERGLCGDLFVKAAACRRLRGTSRCWQARKRTGMPTSRHVPSGTPAVMAAGAGVGATSTSSDSR